MGTRIKTFIGISQNLEKCCLAKYLSETSVKSSGMDLCASMTKKQLRELSTRKKTTTACRQSGLSLRQRVKSGRPSIQSMSRTCLRGMTQKKESVSCLKIAAQISMFGKISPPRATHTSSASEAIMEILAKETRMRRERIRK